MKAKNHVADAEIWRPLGVLVQRLTHGRKTKQFAGLLRANGTGTAYGLR
jgi:hypothetical protein